MSRNGTAQRAVGAAEMVLEAIERRAVLTLHRDYFRLKKPIERRVYELARKAVGQQENWKPWPLEKLHQKSGSRAQLKEFRRAIKELAGTDHLPDCRVEYDETEDTVVFHNRGTMPRRGGTGRAADTQAGALLGSDWPAIARENAPRWHPYMLKAEWDAWRTRSADPIKKNPKAHFAALCRTWYRNHGEA